MVIGLMVLSVFCYGTEWFKYQIDTLISGHYGTAIDLDTLGYPHIMFREYYDRGLMHAWMNSDSTWSMEAVGLQGSYPSMVIDKLGRVHVAFESCGLAYGWRDNGGWHVIYPCPGWGGKNPCLVLDRDGDLHIASMMGYGCDALVVYMYRKEGEWYVEVVDTVSECDHLSLVLDSLGRPHVVYGRLGRGVYIYRPGFRHAVRVGEGEWEIEEVDTVHPRAWVAINPEVAIDSLGRLWVVYEVIDSSGIWRFLKYAWKGSDGEWHIGYVEGGGNSEAEAGDMDLEVDVDGNLHLIYTMFESISRGVLKYGWWGGGEWHVEEVEIVYGPIAIATWDDMVVSRDGVVHIAYSRQICCTESRLWYCWGKPEVGVRDGGEGMGCTEGFRVEPVVSVGKVDIVFGLGRGRDIGLDLYDVSGRRVREIWRGMLGEGVHRISVDLGDLSGGIYFVGLEVSGRRLVRKLVLVR